MTDPTDERLPFLDKRGVLYIAPLGSERPALTVREGKFVMTWPASWIRPKPYDPSDPDSAFTDPRACTAREEIDTDAVQVTEFFAPTLMTTSRTALWDFGPEVAAAHHRVMRSPPNITAQPRMMLGWESEDCLDRVLAPQTFFDEYGLIHLELHQLPRPAPPRRTWWQRLLRRPVKVPPMPSPDPLFEVYRVGELRKV